MLSRMPYEMKRLGRLACGANNIHKCEAIRFEVLERGILAKFEQNPHLRVQLLKSGAKVLARAVETEFMLQDSHRITTML